MNLSGKDLCAKIQDDCQVKHEEVMMLKKLSGSA